MRIVCYCDDCQHYAKHLGAEVLDSYGGTDIYQTTPAHVRITEGAEELRCLRLSEKGLFRWYSGCCNAPLANTLGTAQAPFVGIVHTFMDHASHGQTRDESLGTPVFTQGKFAIGGVPSHAHPTAPISVILRAIRGMVVGRIRGEHKPSPFFDESGKCVVEPQVLSSEVH